MPGTAGLGAQCVKAFAQHNPAHIYFSGRNKEAGESLITQIKGITPSTSLTFIQMDLSSLASVKSASLLFTHDRLDILMCNAGVMDAPPELSVDGFEIHFATNHLGHSMLIRQLLPILVKTAENPAADVRIVILSSVAWRLKPKGGVTFATVTTKQESGMASVFRYGSVKSQRK
jgi:NAD(P)-dependent dehydrogenase (short-subunit alcohol dehydrogenase family)